MRKYRGTSGTIYTVIEVHSQIRTGDLGGNSSIPGLATLKTLQGDLLNRGEGETLVMVHGGEVLTPM